MNTSRPRRGGAVIDFAAQEKMSVESIRKKGYLYKLPVKGFVKKWSRRWFVLHGTTRAGVVRIEYYDNEGCEITGEGKRTIPLRDCSSLSEMVGSKVHPYVFQFKTPLGQHVFASDSQVDLDEWTDAIQEAVHEDRLFRKSQKQKTAKLKSSNSGVPDQKKYTVTLEETETTKQMALQGAFHLEIGPSTLSLVKVESGARIATWHYKHLKNFGKQSGQFYFEIGALPGVATKPGHFVCLTSSYKEIFSMVNNNIKKLRENASKKKQDKQPIVTKSEPSHPKPVPETKQPKQQEQNIRMKQAETSPPVKTESQTTEDNPPPQSVATNTNNARAATLKYSVIAAGGRAAGRTGTTNPGISADKRDYPQVHEDGFIYENDDGFSYDSFDSFDSFDDDSQQPIAGVVNPLTTNTEASDSVDFDQPTVEVQTEEEYVVESVSQHDVTSESTTEEPTIQGNSTEPLIAAASDAIDKATTPPHSATDHEKDLASELDKLQDELGISELANLDIGAPGGSENAFSTGFQEATMDDIANFDLNALLQTTGIPSEPLVGDINPEVLANLDLGAMSPDFLQPIEPIMDMDVFSTEINQL